MNSREALERLWNYKGSLGYDDSYDPPVYCGDYPIFGEELEVIEKDLEALEIIKKHTLIQKNGDGFTITVWFNTENCDFKSCASMEEILKVRKVLEEK